jgi:ribonuclease-3
LPPPDDSLDPTPRQSALLELADRIGHSFKNLDVLDRALVHASMGNIGKPNYERLEFLGDAVLGFVVADHLFHQKLEVPAGELTDRRSKFVSRQPLAAVARRLDLPRYVETGRGLRDEELGSPRIQADLVEAVLGAVYVDGGIRAARKFVRRHIVKPLAAQMPEGDDQRDPKSRLLHLVQSLGLGQPSYRVVSVEGPDHERVFTVVVAVAGTEYATGTARSKRAAEKRAAEATLAEADRLRAAGEARDAGA